MKLTKPAIDAPMVDWALWWGGRGWRVFPCWWPVKEDLCGCGKLHTNNDSGKHPISKCAPEGFKNGTTDPETIRRWWTQYPQANIGATPLAGQIVIDIDGPLDEGVVFPDTWTHTTGKGEHKIYVDNIEYPLPQSQGKLWTNVDTRISDVGYIILPPSMHKSGTRYLIKHEAPVIEFPSDMAKDACKPKRKASPKSTSDEIIKLLTIARDDSSLGDDAMAKVAGYLARYIPDKDHWFATISAINMSLVSPLDETAMNKKKNIFDKHHESIKESIQKAIDDEARGWLFEVGDAGYSTQIDVKGSLEFVPFSDFRVQCRGIVKSKETETYIIDFYKDGALYLEAAKLSASVLVNPAKLREWLANHGMLLYPHQKDVRSNPGVRLMALMQNQNPAQLQSRDYFGWSDEVKAFIIPDGQVTADGLIPLTTVYPEDRIRETSPVRYLWETDLAQARDWFKRVLALQPASESGKVGAWAMMLLLRGQWKGILPGLSVDAFAGTGKTTFFQLFGKLIGSTNEGERLTLPSARDQLAGNESGYVWFDDSKLDDALQELVRQTITQQKIKKKGGDNFKSTEEYQLRGSVIISGEGSEIGRQKAIRDRFVPIDFVVNPTPDAEKLKRENIERASGVILQEVLKHAHMLPELESLREGIDTRDKQAQTTLRMGARILDAVLDTGNKYTMEIDAWFNGDAVTTDQGNASENILHTYPRLWLSLGEPKIAGFGEQVNPLFYNDDEGCFYINAARCSAAIEGKIRDPRIKELTSKNAMLRELKACDAEGDQPVKTRVGGAAVKGKTVKYSKLPRRYSDMILKAIDYIEED